MGMFDWIRLEYPLPVKEDQDLEFQTKDLSCDMRHYWINLQGHLFLLERHTVQGDTLSLPILQEDFHGDIVIYFHNPRHYKIRFTHGVVEWIKVIDDWS